MDTIWQDALWQQFGAAIDTLDNMLITCPDDLWQAQLWQIPDEPTGFTEFWYLTYHTLFWLDFHLSGGDAGFRPPQPFTLDELDPAGLLPQRPYTKVELRAYLAHCRQKCQVTIAALTAERAAQPHQYMGGAVSFVSLLLNNMRHVQEHGAQLSLFLGQQRGLAARWVPKAKA